MNETPAGLSWGGRGGNSPALLHSFSLFGWLIGSFFFSFSNFDEKGVSDLIGCWCDISEETQAGLLAVLVEPPPLDKQAGYHITNIYLTPLQKVWRGLCAGRGGGGGGGS